MLTWLIPLALAASDTTKLFVTYDRRAFRLEVDAKSFTYREAGRTYAIPRPKCAVFQEVERPWRELASVVPNERASDYDVVVENERGKRTYIARGARLGTWLRDLPKTLPYLDARARVACRR